MITGTKRKHWHTPITRDDTIAGQISAKSTETSGSLASSIYPCRSSSSLHATSRNLLKGGVAIIRLRFFGAEGLKPLRFAPRSEPSGRMREAAEVAELAREHNALVLSLADLLEDVGFVITKIDSRSEEHTSE